MALPLSSQGNYSSSPLRAVLLLVLFILLISGVFYMLFQRGFFAKIGQSSARVPEKPVIDLQSAASDPRFVRLKALEPVPELETTAGRDNPFVVYQVRALTPSQGTKKIK